MGKLFTREQARQFLKENNLKDADSIGNALVAQFKDLLQEALEAEMEHEHGYSKVLAAMEESALIAANAIQINGQSH